MLFSLKKNALYEAGHLNILLPVCFTEIPLCSLIIAITDNQQNNNTGDVNTKTANTENMKCLKSYCEMPFQTAYKFTFCSIHPKYFV